MCFVHTDSLTRLAPVSRPARRAIEAKGGPALAELAGGAVGTIRLPRFVRVVLRGAFQTARLLGARLVLPTRTFKTKRLAGFVLVVPRVAGVALCGLGGHT